MLGDDVVNKTVPLILCAEENVVGNHGATIGELDEDTLFYFESRGISAAEAENIIVVNADNARMRAPVLIFIVPILFGDFAEVA